MRISDWSSDGCSSDLSPTHQGRTMIITPGAMTLGDWRAIYEGESAALDAGAWNAIDASAAAVARIVAKGAPVYGINTGFGKLASVRIIDSEIGRAHV